MEDRLMTHSFLNGVVGADAVVVVVVVGPVVLALVLPDVVLFMGCLTKALCPLKNVCQKC